ncbi:hypothetical protein ACFL60_04405 [Candidatus Omnitrophota bacterium]
MKKLLVLFVIIVAFYSSKGRCEDYQEFSHADSLLAKKQYLLAIEAYSVFLDGDNADYALYKTGLSKNGLAGYCVSTYQFNKYPDTYKRRYGENYQTYLAYMEYIEKHKGEFGYFEPEGMYISEGADFRKIISDYPESDLVDNSAYELLLQSRHIDWEGDYRDMLPRIEQCKRFLESYPDSDVRDKVIYLCFGDYNNVLGSWEFPDSLEIKYQKEIEAFKQRWRKKEE